MPRSIFLGAPWPQPGEPLWTDDDRAWAYALADLERETCSGCGQSLEECTAEGADDDYKVHPVRCHACAAKASRLDGWEGDRGGLMLYVTRDPRVAAR